jgi:ATP-dependent Lhr-like helicase
MQANDNGMIFRFPGIGGLPAVDLLRSMTAAEARERILRELPNSAAFGARFRMNAARALLLPRARGQRRTPFWLQRLKAKDLLGIVRQFKDFPIVVETYRDCLRDVFDLPHLEDVLERIRRGDIEIVKVESAVPSPIAAGMLYYFANQYLYEWDVPKAERQLQTLSVRRELLEELMGQVDLSELLQPEAIAEVTAKLGHRAPGYQARSIEELAVFLDELGDLSEEEIDAIGRRPADAEDAEDAEGGESQATQRNTQARAWLAELARLGRVIQVEVMTPAGARMRWVPAELAPQYRAPGKKPGSTSSSARYLEAEAILSRFLRHAGPVTRDAIRERYAFEAGWLDETLARLVAARALLKGRFTPADVQPGGPRPIEEYCHPQVLEEIHRRTLAILRQEVQPVPLSAYQDFLLCWQHVSGQARLAGPGGLPAIMQQLQGVSLPGSVWERDVLPARLVEYEPADLDDLCAGGEYIWVGSGRDPRRAPFRFVLRGNGHLFLGEPDETALSADARLAYEQLKAEGASFSADVQAGTGLRTVALEAALIELVMSSLATNDSLATLRQIVEHGGERGPLANGGAAQGGTGERSGRPLSPLEAQLAARLQQQRPLTSSRYRSAKRRVAQRMHGETPASRATGRWALVHRLSVLGRPPSPDERAARLAGILLARYGLLTRDLAEREELGGEWPSLYAHLQRMEMRGEVRRGYFIAGLSGAQFALPEAVEQLRSGANEGAHEADLVVLNAADPANLSGILAEPPSTASAETPRAARLPSTTHMLRGGQTVLIAENNGERITTLPGTDRELAGQAMRAYLGRPNAPHHAIVAQWNGTPIFGSEGEETLRELGFYRSPAGMEWWVGR